jgi:hypothetical protein
MTSVRTQDKRHWIQLEVMPNGQQTGAKFMDLNMVDSVDFTRDPKTDDPDYVGFVSVFYAGEMKAIGLKGDQANWFYQTWVQFLAETSGAPHATAPKAVPGIIEIPQSIAAKGLRNRN